MKRDLTPWAIVWSAAFIAACLVLGACAPTSAYVAARKAQETASITVDASYRTWRDYDRAHQEQIVQASGDIATAKELLAQYRAGTQHPVDEAFVTARNAVAAMDEALAAAGAATAKDYTTAITKLLGALTMLAAILSEYGVTVPIPSPTSLVTPVHQALRIAFAVANNGGRHAR